jgi:hypothetical protein
MASESDTKFVNVSIKMLSGDFITLEVPSYIIHKDFYQMVWKLIPEKISSNAFDLLREDSEEPLSVSAEFLEPKEDEIFFVLIQTSYFRIYLRKLACAYLRSDYFVPGSSFYDAYEIVVQDMYPVVSSDSHSLSVPDEKSPIDQDGNRISLKSKQKPHCIPFFVKYHSDAEDNITGMPPIFYDDLHVEVRQIDNNLNHLDVGEWYFDWNIDIPDDKKPLSSITDLLDELPVSKHTLKKLKRELLLEWYDEFDYLVSREQEAKLREMRGYEEEEDDIGSAGQAFDEGEFDLSGNYWERNQ